MVLAGALVLALAFPPSPVRAGEASACAAAPGIGCYFVPEGAAADAPLLIFLRGHHPDYGAKVPAAKYLASARRAFTSFGLGRIASEKGAVLLVSYRSGLGVTAADVEALAKTTRRAFSTIIVAAHSGGYEGLGKTLDAGVSPSRLVLLDSFYGADSDGLPQKVQRLISTGTSCSGFLTPHNKKNYDAGFKHGTRCSIDAMDDNSKHNEAVGRCLGGYLKGLTCL